MPKFRLLNRQRRDTVPLAWLGGLARCAARSLKIASGGELIIAFVDEATMRRLHGTFLRQRTMTDVLTFHYDGSDVLGEIVIAPAAARAYAARHKISYRQELARYVVHGLLHWLGHEDRTRAQQRRMRTMEDALLTHCGS